MDVLQEKGLCIGEPYVKHLQDEIWELRPLRNRIMYAWEDDNTIVILTFFIKHSQKTPGNEINRAIKAFNYYKESKDE